MSEFNVAQCLDVGPDCQGRVEYRMPLSGTGRAFPRCDRHWELRLAEQQRITQLYPEQPPRDFDPLDAGERWDDDDDDGYDPIIPGESPDPDWMNP